MTDTQLGLEGEGLVHGTPDPVPEGGGPCKTSRIPGIRGLLGSFSPASSLHRVEVAARLTFPSFSTREEGLSLSLSPPSLPPLSPSSSLLLKIPGGVSH